MEARSELERWLAETRWLSALARRLIDDSATADDLAQDAWVTALERPPRAEPARHAWFARVLTNLARQRARDARARRTRETLTARDEVQHDDVVERAESSRKLVEHVLALEEPYRSTVLARYFDELTPERIARRDRLNPSTVRTRLERGLAMLRERIERKGGRDALTAFLPLARGPLSPVDVAASSRAITGTAVRTAASSTASATIGVFTMAAIIKVCIGIAALAVAAWWMWPRSDEDMHVVALTPELASPTEDAALAPNLGDSRTRVESTIEAPTMTQSPQPRATDALDDEALRAESNTAVEPGVIEGLVLRQRRPVDGRTVYFWSGYFRPMAVDPSAELGPWREQALESRPIGTDGRFRITGLDAGDYWLGIDTGLGVGAQCSVRLTADQPGRRVVVELGAARVEGSVYDADGRPIEGATVRVDIEVAGRNYVRFGDSGGDGRYSVDELPAGSGWRSVNRRGNRDLWSGKEEMQRVLSLGPTEVRRIDFGSPRPRTTWAGRVLTRAGTQVKLSGLLGHSSENHGYTEVSFERGSFELRLIPGSYALHIALSEPNGAAQQRLSLGEFDVAAHDFERDLTLPHTAVHGRVTGFANSEIPRDVHVGLWTSSNYLQHSTSPASDGTFEFFGVTPGEWRVGVGVAGQRGLLGESHFTVLATDLELNVEVGARTR